MTRLEVYQKQQRIFLNIKHKGQENQNALSSLLDGFIGGTNGVLQTHIPRNAVNRIHTDLAAFTKMLDRHLTDENDPIILKHHKD
ncbi:MAG: hypothetical protein IT544_03415, partial [Rhodobacteraceae bacterium]|nr:hypothetical protein [Paracoccaceae bacterium]